MARYPFISCMRIDMVTSDRKKERDEFMTVSNDTTIKALEKELQRKKTVYRDNMEKLLAKAPFTEAQKNEHRKKHDKEVRALQKELILLKAKI